MSSFLQICQDFRQEAGLAGTGPASVKSQVGMDKKIVDWIRNAWINLQESQRTWRFMWKGDGSITCIADIRSYDPVSLGFDVRNVIYESVTCRASGTQVRIPLSYIPYNQFKTQCLNLQPVTGRPTIFTWSPDNKLMLHPIPSSDFVVEFEYYRNPQELTENTDVPIMPSRYHRVLVYLALTHYAVHDDAITIYQDSKVQASKLLDSLHADQLEYFAATDALA